MPIVPTGTKCAGKQNTSSASSNDWRCFCYALFILPFVDKIENMRLWICWKADNLLCSLALPSVSVTETTTASNQEASKSRRIASTQISLSWQCQHSGIKFGHYHEISSLNVKISAGDSPFLPWLINMNIIYFSGDRDWDHKWKLKRENLASWNRTRKCSSSKQGRYTSVETAPHHVINAWVPFASDMINA